MRRVRGGFGSTLGLAAAAGGTTWFAFFAWRGFTHGSAQFLLPLLVLAAAIAVSGAVARWARIPAPLVVLVQVLVSGALASAMLSGSPLPVGAAWVELRDSLDGAIATAQQYAAPVPAVRDGVHPLLVLGGLPCLLLVDVLACTLRRVPLAGLPLLTVYSVPVSILAGGVPWWVFAVTAGGFLLMLFLQMNEQLTRWGRPLGSEEASDPTGFSVSTGAIRASAGTIGAATTGLAIVLPLLIPTLDLNLLEVGRGPGDGDITVTNPMADLRRDLLRGDDIPLLRVTTDDPAPAYLRISVLNRFSDNEWSSGDREVPTDQLANGELPAPEGVSGTIDRKEYTYEVAVTENFESRWLPTQAPVSAVRAEGDWRYDERTMDFLAGDDGLTTAGLEYSMTGVQLDLSAVSMARAPSAGGQVDVEFLDLPPGLPSEVSDLAFQVTRGIASRFQQAQALQKWFREDGGFTYDINTAEGNGTDELVRFLTESEGGRTGYCEQFAAAMAVMARTLGIPSRVAVGFLEPELVGNHVYEYSAWDMHAWPELYFPGSGWVRFEPTPPGRASGVPAYTTERVPESVTTSGPEVPREDDLPSRGDSSSAVPEEDPEAAAGGDRDSGFPWLPVGGGLAGALLLAGLALLPRTVRTRRSRARLGTGPEAAWLELRDTARDLGVPWPEHRSPRQTRDRLVDHLGLPVDADSPERPPHGPDVSPDAVSALDLIVHAVERQRYARPDGTATGPALRAELETVVASLHGGASRRARRAAAWWPRSVLSRTRVRRRGPQATVTVRHGAVVDHVG